MQNDCRQVGPLDFRRGESLAGEIVLLAEQPDADAGTEAAAAPFPLVGGSLRNGLNRQPLDLAAGAVAADAGGAGIDDVANARHGQRRLRHIRRQHNPPAAVLLKHAVLLRRREPGIERKDFGIASGEVASPEFLVGLADVPLGRQKNQNVPIPEAAEVLDRIGDAADGVNLLFARSIVIHERLIADLHRISAAGDFDNRRGACARFEMLREPRGVNGGAGDNEPQVGPLGKDAVQAAEEEIDIKGPLVGFVDDDGVVLVESAVGLRFRQQHAVGHHLDQRLIARLIGKADFVAHELAAGRAKLFRQASSNGTSRNPPRLGVADEPAAAAADLQADFGDLRGLSAAGLAADDDDLMIPNRRRDVLSLAGDRQ